jgi:hypothetical protein
MNHLHAINLSHSRNGFFWGFSLSHVLHDYIDSHLFQHALGKADLDQTLNSLSENIFIQSRS